MDQGGLNNIRLVFEYVAIVAAITGRTLVLPPRQSWYLVNHGPRHRGHGEGGTRFSELFDILALQQVLRVLTTEEFVEEAAGHLPVPERFRRRGAFDYRSSDDTHWKLWRDWLHENSEMPDWNPYDTVIAFPDRARADLSWVTADYIDGRDIVEFTPVLNASPIIYFPSNSGQRYLGPVATMLIGEDETLPALTRRFLKHHVRYHPAIFALAEECIRQLPGLFKYHAIHIRRNDFQYEQTRANASTSLGNIEALLDQGLPVYVATDEVDEEFRRSFRLNHQVYFWEDVMRRYTGPGIPDGLIGPIEQLICAGAHRFIGTDLSTFSTYIVRLRGYLRAPDTASYFHTEHYAGPLDAPGTDNMKGRCYLRENPLYWLDC